MTSKAFTKALIYAFLAATLVGCGGSVYERSTSEPEEVVVEEEASNEATDGEEQPADVMEGSSDNETQAAVVTAVDMVEGGAIDTTDLFTERDLTQTVDTSDATHVTLSSGQDVEITSEGVYVISGSAEDVTIRVSAADTDKVQIVLDGASITNADAPCIYVVSADKVFVTTTEGTTSTLTVTDAFAADGDTTPDAVIFSKDDLVVNGLGTLVVSSSDNGITCKDDLKVTGGTIVIDCASDGLEANDSVRIAGGDITITTPKDGVHVEYDEDDSVGFFYQCGGSLAIQAGDDGVHATTYVQIDGGTLNINAAEAIEATVVQLNGGDVEVYATDDGINASWKSESIGTPTIEINGGNLVVSMAQGDTDALDSNGYLIVNGGTVDITAQFAFDFEYGAEMNGGTATVNGEQVTQITESMMGGGAMGGPGMGGGPMGGAPGGGFGGPGF